VDTYDCAYQRPDDSGRSGLNAALYALAGVCLLCLIPAAVILARRAVRRRGGCCALGGGAHPGGEGVAGRGGRADGDDLLGAPELNLNGDDGTKNQAEW